MGERACDATGHHVRPPAVVAALVVACVSTLAACSGHGNDNVAKGVRRPASGAIVCPITAEQVGHVLGAPMTRDDASCSFYPTDGALAPNATFNRELPVAFTSAGRSQARYTEPVTGIGDQAFLTAPGPDGTRLLARAGSLRFEIRVQHDKGAPEARRAAVQLARLVIESN